MKQRILLSFLLISQLCMLAQKEIVPTGNFKKDWDLSNQLTTIGATNLAANFYPSLIASEKLNADQYLQIGLNYLKLSDAAHAIDVFKVLVNKFFVKVPISRYYLANAYFRNGDYDLSKVEYQTFLNNYTFSTDSFKKQVSIELYNCDTAALHATKSNRKELSLMSKDSFGTSPAKDLNANFYYVSEGKQVLKTDELHLYTNNVLLSAWNNENEGKIINKEFVSNDEQLQDFNVSIDGKIAIITIKSTDKMEHLYYARFENNLWSKPVRFPEPVNSNLVNAKQGAILLINNFYYLYYSADKPSGEGGFDIYVAKLNSTFDILSDSLIGNGVNSKADECTPFYNAQNASLYFSSNRLINTFGGFDIFLFKKELSTQVINLGKPFNSGADDLFYRVCDSEGYLVSNRPSNEDLHPFSNRIYQFAVAKNQLNIAVNSNYKLLTNYDLAIDENSLRIYNSDTSKTHSVEIQQNKKYRIKIKKENYQGIDTTIYIGNLEEGANMSLSFQLDPIITMEGKVYFVDYDSTAPQLKECKVQLFDESQKKESVLYTTTINKQNRRYSFVFPTDKVVRLKVSADGYNTYDTILSLNNFESPGGVINNIQLHQILKNNVVFLDSMFVKDDEIRSYNDFDISILPTSKSYCKNENSKAELKIVLLTTDINKSDFSIPPAIEDIINKYFVKNIEISKQIVKTKTTSMNQEWYKLFLTYK